VDQVACLTGAVLRVEARHNHGQSRALFALEALASACFEPGIAEGSDELAGLGVFRNEKALDSHVDRVGPLELALQVEARHGLWGKELARQLGS